MSSRISFTSWGEGASLALVGHPSSDSVTIKVTYWVDVSLHRPASQVFSACTVPPDSKETDLGSSDQEASPSAGKNTRIVSVSCYAWKCVPTAMFSGVDTSKVPGCHVLRHEFSVRVTKLHVLVFVFRDFNVHHKEWLISSGGTDRPAKQCYNFSISNDLTQMVDFRT